MGGCKGRFIVGWQILKCDFNFNKGVLTEATIAAQ